MKGKEVFTKIGWTILWLFLVFGLLLQFKLHVSGEATLLETLFNLTGFAGALPSFLKEVKSLQYPVASFIGQLIGLAVMGSIIGIVLQETKQIKQWVGFTLGFALGYLGLLIALCFPTNFWSKAKKTNPQKVFLWLMIIISAAAGTVGFMWGWGDYYYRSFLKRIFCGGFFIYMAWLIYFLIKNIFEETGKT